MSGGTTITVDLPFEESSFIAADPGRATPPFPAARQRR